MANTKCPCGESIKVELKKPNSIAQTVSKSNCKACKSKYLVKCSYKKETFPREYKTSFEILNLSNKAKETILKVTNET